MNLTIDFETRSTVDLRKAGAWRYAEDPSTEVMCLALKVDDKEPVLYFPGHFYNKVCEWQGAHDKPDALDNAPSLPSLPFKIIHDVAVEDLIRNADIIEAHNAEFERAIWFNVMHKRHGFKDLPPEKVRCSAAKAAMHSLPRDLYSAGIALGVKVQKDMDGRRLMLKMCKPRAPRKEELKQMKLEGRENEILWHETPEQIVRLAAYCASDVDSEHELSRLLRDLPPKEQSVWRLDQTINQRGVFVDRAGVEAAINFIGAHENRLLQDMGEVCPWSPTQVVAVRDWLATRGVETESLDKNAVAALLARADLPQDARLVLATRQSLSKSSTAKYEAMAACVCGDDRIRGLHMYHGAGTGRWSGKLVQTQNLPRGKWKDVGPAIDLIMEGDLDAAEMLYGDPMDLASSCLRSMLMARPGCDLLCADFSGIEARALAFLAHDTALLEVFRSGQDVYKVAAQDVFDVPKDQISKDQRQIGKVVILACGYQGHVGAFQSMAEVYGVTVSDERAAEIVNAWRDNNKAIVRFWYDLEDAAKTAVQRPGVLVKCGPIAYQVRQGFLVCRLPSGRFLFYPRPYMAEKKTPSGSMKMQIHYWGVDTYTRQWGPQSTYGGKLTENVVQAFCADLLREAMLRVEESGYPIVMHVHDEIVSEVPEGFGSLEDFENLMSEAPSWADGMPISAEGWRGKRYRK